MPAAPPVIRSRLRPGVVLAGSLAGSLAAALVSACSPTPRPASSATLALLHVTLIDGTGAPPAPDATVVVADGRIASVGRADRVAVPKGARVVDGRGAYLIPGLWDAHVHLSPAGECALPALLAHGVTSVRDMGGNLAETARWRAGTAAGTLPGPRIWLAGPILESARWLAAVRDIPLPKGLEQFPLWDIGPRVAVAGPDDARRAVDSLAGLGVDFIKVRTVASPATFAALAAAARRQRLAVAAHAPGMDLGMAAEAGIGSVEHTETIYLALAAKPAPGPGRASPVTRTATEAGAVFARTGTWITPTLVAGQRWRLTPDAGLAAGIADTSGRLDPRQRLVSPLLRDYWRVQAELRQYEGPNDWAAQRRAELAQLRALHAAGAGLLAGTDLGVPLVFPGASLHDELASLVADAGLSPLEALQAATRNPPHLFGLERELGTVERGKRADLVLLEADPLADIRNTTRIRAVVQGGRVLDRAALDGLRAQAERAAQTDRPRCPLGPR
jgi:imidazolonepropionase-like amidohydrolase